MNRTGINSDVITKKERIVVNDVSVYYVANYGDSDMIVTVNNVPEVVPAYDETNKYARSIQYSDPGGFFPLDITIDFVGGSGKAVLRYSVYKPNQC